MVEPCRGRRLYIGGQVSFHSRRSVECQFHPVSPLSVRLHPRFSNQRRRPCPYQAAPTLAFPSRLGNQQQRERLSSRRRESRTQTSRFPSTPLRTQMPSANHLAVRLKPRCVLAECQSSHCYFHPV